MTFWTNKKTQWLEPTHCQVHCRQEWRRIDPSLYLSPFLDVIQSDDVPAAATGVALSSVLKIFRLQVFDEKTPGAKDAIGEAVTAVTGCRLEKTDPVSEDAVMMRILLVLSAIMRHRASCLLTDHGVCTLVNSCFQVRVLQLQWLILGKNKIK